MLPKSKFFKKVKQRKFYLSSQGFTFGGLKEIWKLATKCKIPGLEAMGHGESAAVLCRPKNVEIPSAKW